MRARGLTFIELLFVMVTLAIVLAATVPRFSRSFDRLRTERVAFEIVQLLRYAHATAVTSRQVILVALDEERRALALASEQEGDAVPLEDRVARSQPWPETVSVSISAPRAGGEGSASAMRFYPDGTSEPALITVADETGERYQIAVDEATGQAALRRGTAAL